MQIIEHKKNIWILNKFHDSWCHFIILDRFLLCLTKFDFLFPKMLPKKSIFFINWWYYWFEQTIHHCYFHFVCNGLSIGELCCSDDLWLFEYKNTKITKKIGIKINMVVGLLLVTLGLLLFIFVKNRYAYLVIPIPIGIGSLIFNSITNTVVSLIIPNQELGAYFGLMNSFWLKSTGVKFWN